jgi:hypothetical protein
MPLSPPVATLKNALGASYKQLYGFRQLGQMWCVIFNQQKNPGEKNTEPTIIVMPPHIRQFIIMVEEED